MAAHIPITKFIALAVKTLSKPVASSIKKGASEHKVMQEVLYALGQANHRITSLATIRAAGYQAVSIKPLDRATAVAKGGDLFGEMFIFSIGGALLVWEYNSGLEKTALKEEKARKAREAEQAALEARFSAIHVRLDEMEKHMHAINSRRSDSVGLWGTRAPVASASPALSKKDLQPSARKTTPPHPSPPIPPPPLPRSSPPEPSSNVRNPQQGDVGLEQPPSESTSWIGSVRRWLFLPPKP